MGDEKDPVGGSAGDSKDEQNQQEFEEGVHNESENDAELYDKDGKPLPWNRSKRFRRLYGEAKDGRRITQQLRDAGISAADLPRLQNDLQELNEFRTAYANWERQKAAGNTSKADDRQAAEAEEQEQALKARLRKLGVVLKDDDGSPENVTNEKSGQILIRQAQDIMVEALEGSEGFDTLETSEKKERLAEIDFKVGRKLKNDPSLLEAFRSGSLAPIRKIVKELLGASTPKGGPKPRQPEPGNKPFVKRTPPRLGSGSGSEGGHQPKQTPIKNIKDATASMLEDLRAAKSNREE